MTRKIVVLFLVLCSSHKGIQHEFLNLPEGSICKWNGMDGVCTAITGCRSAVDGIRRKVYPPICGYQKVAIVCCNDCELLNKLTVPDITVESRLNNYGNKARKNCMNYLKTFDYPCNVRTRFANEEQTENNCFDHKKPSSSEDHGQIDTLLGLYLPPKSKNQAKPNAIPVVSFGKPAWRNQYPHMALLGYGNDNKTTQWLCGGSVISDKFILTAAHCISSPAVGTVKYAAVGILSRSDPPELWHIYNVKRIVRYPEYKPPSKYHDIALLETENTIAFNMQVLPACLHVDPESAELADATGWGALGHRKKLADTLQTVTLQRIEEEQCAKLYPKHRHLRKGYNQTIQMCYGHREDPKNTCEGDSGGPLQIKKTCAYTILGVTAAGRSCGFAGGSGIYTRVYHYVPWIESIVWA